MFYNTIKIRTNVRSTMMAYLFEGSVRVYLQGQDALLPLSITDDKLVSAIGEETTKLIINDHRRRTIHVVKEFLKAGEQNGFVKAFNQPARAKINYSHDEDILEVELYDDSSSVEYPILWMGILEDNKMPAHPVKWEILKPTLDNQIAFAALIP